MSYFQFTHHRRFETDSLEDVSPFSEPTKLPHRPERPPRRPQLRQRIRPYSDGILTPQMLILTKRQDALLSKDFDKHTELMSENENLVVDDSSHRRAGEWSKVQSDSRPIKPSNISVNSTSEEAGIVRNKAEAIAKSRSIPKDIIRHSWTCKSRIRHSLPSSSHDRNTVFESTAASRTPIQPLRPPSIATIRTEPRSEHRVTIEKAFTERFIADEKANTVPDPPKRPNSIAPARLLSASLSVLRIASRKNVRQQQTRVLVVSEDRAKRQYLAIQDHKTSLRKQHTTNVLARVSSALQELHLFHAKSTSISGNTSSSHLANSTQVSNHARLGAESAESSLCERESISSSLANLRMGQNPNNTPDEHAKYTVYDQDGQPQQYLKVDISVRGHTSYLPSEARRIHTPPLPGQGQEARRKGFFFDYDKPEMSNLKVDTGTNTAGLANMNHRHVSIMKDDRAHISLSKYKVGNRIRPGDWYGTQLSQFETPTGERSANTSQHIDNEAETSSSYFDEAQELLRKEAQLDYSVPEHLPTSPLCPRHPRFWRIVKGKGSQFRGCWMHGFGEFSNLEKIKYRIDY